MRIHSIELKNFRGIEELKIDDISDTGVTVIHGRNEAGKTTILKAIEALFNYKFSSKAAGVKSLQTVNADVSPEAAMEFSVGPYRLKLSKQWIRQTSALLEELSPNRNTYKGEEAESQLNEILSRNLDRSLFDAMFLSQDDLHEGIEAAGISSVAGVLSNQTGEDSAQGEDAEAATELMKKVDSLYERYFSLKTGIEAKELKTARTEHVEAETELEEASRALNALAEYVERYERAQELEQETEKQLPDAKQEVAEHNELIKEIESLEQAFASQVKDEELAQASLKQALSQLEERQKLREGLEDAERDMRDNSAAVETAKIKAEEETEKVTELSEARNFAEQQYEQARELTKESRAKFEALQRKVQVHQLRSKSASVESHAKKLTEIAAALEKFGQPVLDADVHGIEKLEQDLELELRLREAAVSKLILSAQSAQNILVNGDEVEVTNEGHSVELTEGLTLTIGEVTAHFEPGTGASSGQELERKIDKLTEQLRDELEKFGCATTEELRAKRDEYKELVSQHHQLEAELKGALDGETLEQLRARAVAFGDTGESVDEEIPDADALDKAQAEIAEAVEAEDKAAHELSSARAKLEPWKERPARFEHIRVQAKAEQALNHHASLQAEIEKAAEEVSDAALQEKFQAAQAEVEKRTGEVQTAREALNAANPELAHSLAEGAQAKLTNLETQLRKAQDDQHSLSGHIQMQTGVAERVEKAEAAEEHARNILLSTEQRASAVKHLREVLVKHQRRARERYAAPFAQQLGQLAGRIFNGKVEFHLNDDLVVEKRTLDGVTVGLQDLSGGAKEQMAILTRFAIAQLLSKGGEQGAPVVVDDALGSTDAHRVQLMATLFAEVGKQSQVIVFTCEPSRYDRVPNSTLLDIDHLKASAPIG